MAWENGNGEEVRDGKTVMERDDMKLKVIEGWEIKSVNREARTFWAVASTEEKDRDGDVISSKGWDLKHFKDNPVILWAHDYRELPVAKALNIQKGDGKLRFKPQFAAHEKAQAVFDLYADGFLKAFSVGFIPQVSEDMEDGGKFFKKAELLEISAVPVPSNPGALAEIRAKGIEAVEKPGYEETENEVRYRVREPGQFQEDSFRRITLKKDKPRVFATIGKLEGETTTTTQSLAFPKDDEWTIPKARTWVKAHPDAVKFIDMAEMLGMLPDEDKKKSTVVIDVGEGLSDAEELTRQITEGVDQSFDEDAIVTMSGLDKLLQKPDDEKGYFVSIDFIQYVSTRLTALENSQKALPDDGESGEGVEANPEPPEAEPKLEVQHDLTSEDIFRISKKRAEDNLTFLQGGILDKEVKT